MAKIYLEDVWWISGGYQVSFWTMSRGFLSRDGGYQDDGEGMAGECLENVWRIAGGWCCRSVGWLVDVCKIVGIYLE